jgi:hypothetical protein
MPDNVPQSEFEWLVIYLIYNNNYYDRNRKNTEEYYTMEEQTRFIMRQIEIADYHECVKVIVAEAKVEYNRDWVTLTISEKVKNRLERVENPQRTKDYGMMTDRASLTSILTVINDKFKANKHLIITAGHGSIVGVNYYIPEMKPNSSKPELPTEIKNIKDRLNYSNWEGNFSRFSFVPYAASVTGFGLKRFTTVATFDVGIEMPDKRMLHILTSQEISETFHDVFGSKKVDVLVMYNCIMQNLFTQYEFRETVNWLVAALSGICIPGYNHTDMLNHLCKDPELVDAEKIASVLIESIDDGLNYQEYKDYIDSSWIISAQKLEKTELEKISDDFDALFEQIFLIAKQKPQIILCISEVLYQMYTYTYHCLKSTKMPDIGIFLAHLKDHIKDYYSNFNSLFIPIEKLQASLTKLKKPVLFEGRFFYKDEISFIEQNPLYKASKLNIGLLLPLQLKSELLNLILNPQNYLNRNAENKYRIPTFLKRSNYGEVVNCLVELPQP